MNDSFLVVIDFVIVIDFEIVIVVKFFDLEKLALAHPAPLRGS